MRRVFARGGERLLLNRVSGIARLQIIRSRATEAIAGEFHLERHKGRVFPVAPGGGKHGDVPSNVKGGQHRLHRLRRGKKWNGTGLERDRFGVLRETKRIAPRQKRRERGTSSHVLRDVLSKEKDDCHRSRVFRSKNGSARISFAAEGGQVWQKDLRRGTEGKNVIVRKGRDCHLSTRRDEKKEAGQP